MVPATLPRKSEKACKWRLGNDEQIDSLRRVASNAVQAIERMRASRTWLVALRSIHEVVNRKTVLARRKQLGQLHWRRAPITVETFEDVVLAHKPAGRKCAPLRANALGLAT